MGEKPGSNPNEGVEGEGGRESKLPVELSLSTLFPLWLFHVKAFMGATPSTSIPFHSRH